MSLVVGSNTSALFAQDALRANQRKTATAMERLSTGLRINSARDDAAGLAISQSMTSQIRGLNQAVRNINDGVNLLQTAEGGLGAITEMLQRMRELAVQSANGTNSDAQRAYLQKEAAALQEQIGKVVDTTTWNDKKLLDGSFTGQKIQVGAHADSTIDIQIPTSMLPSGSPITSYRTNIFGGRMGSAATLATGDLTINGIAIGACDTWDGRDLASAINSQFALTGVTATVPQNTAPAVALSPPPGHSDFPALTGYGPHISGLGIGPIGAAGTSNQRQSQIISAVNARTTDSGVSATADTVTGGVQLAVTGSAQWGIDIGNTSSPRFTSGEIGFQISASDSFTWYRPSIDLDSTSASGISITASGGAAAATGLTSQTVTATITTTSAPPIDISTAAGASSAIGGIDSTLDSVNSNRSNIGSYINRLSYAADNATNISTNIAASRSTIMDTDYAEESANLAKTQIIQQAATAMLAQANQQPQAVLALLKNI